MSELIFHHYAISPFSEKVRLMFGLKGLAWRSVHIPRIMPKPDVIALTGGYRKTPILQIGADVYCDSALIARVLEARQSTPSLFPATQPMAPAFAQWADSVMFWCSVAWAMQPAGIAALLADDGSQDLSSTMKAFAADRAGFAAGMRRMTLADATVQLTGHLAALDAQLAAGGPFLMGDVPTIADFAVVHGLWFIRLARPVAHVLAPYAALTVWIERMLALGHGSSQDMDSGEAVALAAATTTHASCQVEAGLGFETGQEVTVAALDYGVDAVAGSLVGLSATEVVIRRQDARAGTVHVHFPRIGFQIKKESVQ